MTTKPILCVDFDGVIHSYDSGWQGSNVVNDGPVPGAIRWLAEATKLFDVYIHSSRAAHPGGIGAMRQALYKWVQEEFDMIPPWYSNIQFARQKPPGTFLTVDDRAICFMGEFDSIPPRLLLEFEPWNRPEPEPEPEPEGVAPENQADPQDNDDDQRPGVMDRLVSTFTGGGDSGTSSEEVDSAYNEGYRAYEEGRLIDDCPYNEGTLHAQDWESGWLEAEERATNEEG